MVEVLNNPSNAVAWQKFLLVKVDVTFMAGLLPTETWPSPFTILEDILPPFLSLLLHVYYYVYVWVYMCFKLTTKTILQLKGLKISI